MFPLREEISEICYEIIEAIANREKIVPVEEGLERKNALPPWTAPGLHIHPPHLTRYASAAQV